jgi:hypothetical protein
MSFGRNDIAVQTQQSMDSNAGYCPRCEKRARWQRAILWSIPVIAIVALLTVVGLVHIAASIATRGVSPQAQSFEAFAQAHGEPYRLAKIRIRKHTYLVWFAGFEGTFFLFGSGPPCYVFDTSGTLVGWSPVSNDGHCEPMASEAWSPSSPVLTVPEALALLKASAELR